MRGRHSVSRRHERPSRVMRGASLRGSLPMRIRPIAVFVLLAGLAACVDKTLTAPALTRVRPPGVARSLTTPSGQNIGVSVGVIRQSDSLVIARFAEVGASWTNILFWTASPTADGDAVRAYNGLDTLANLLGKIEGPDLVNGGFDASKVPDNLPAHVDSLVRQFTKIHYWTYGNEVNCDA